MNHETAESKLQPYQNYQHSHIPPSATKYANVLFAFTETKRAEETKIRFQKSIFHFIKLHWKEPKFPVTSRQVLTPAAKSDTTERIFEQHNLLLHVLLLLSMCAPSFQHHPCKYFRPFPEGIASESHVHCVRRTTRRRQCLRCTVRRGGFLHYWLCPQRPRKENRITCRLLATAGESKLLSCEQPAREHPVSTNSNHWWTHTEDIQVKIIVMSHIRQRNQRKGVTRRALHLSFTGKCCQCQRFFINKILFFSDGAAHVSATELVRSLSFILGLSASLSPIFFRRLFSFTSREENVTVLVESRRVVNWNRHASKKGAGLCATDVNKIGV